jgi:hypothetical protein
LCPHYQRRQEGDHAGKRDHVDSNQSKPDQGHDLPPVRVKRTPTCRACPIARRHPGHRCVHATGQTARLTQITTLAKAAVLPLWPKKDGQRLSVAERRARGGAVACPSAIRCRNELAEVNLASTISSSAGARYGSMMAKVPFGSSGSIGLWLPRRQRSLSPRRTTCPSSPVSVEIHGSRSVCRWTISMVTTTRRSDVVAT